MYNPPATLGTHPHPIDRRSNSRNVHIPKKMSDRHYSVDPSNHNPGPSENEFSKEERGLLPGEALHQDIYRPLLRAPSAMAVEDDVTSGLLLHQHCLLGFLMDDQNFRIVRLQEYINAH